MVHGSQNRGSWASWGPTIIFSEKKSPYLNNLSLDPKQNWTPYFRGPICHKEKAAYQALGLCLRLGRTIRPLVGICWTFIVNLWRVWPEIFVHGPFTVIENISKQNLIHGFVLWSCSKPFQVLISICKLIGHLTLSYSRARNRSKMVAISIHHRTVSSCERGKGWWQPREAIP